MRKHLKIIILILIVSFLLLTYLLVSCPWGVPVAQDKDIATLESKEGSMAEPVTGRMLEEKPQQVGAESQRKIIHNADLELETADVTDTVRQLKQLAEELEGIVAETNIYNVNPSRQQASVLLRIPEKHFYRALDAIEEMGKLLSRRTYTDDVTLEYIDLEARIRNLESQEKRYRELLEKAENVEEILKVERELERIRGELEAQTGQFNYLKNRVDYGTINISIKEIDPQETAISSGFAGFGGRLVASFLRNTNHLLNALAAVIIFLIGGLPVLIPLAVLAFFVYKGVNWVIKKRAGKPPAG